MFTLGVSSGSIIAPSGSSITDNGGGGNSYTLINTNLSGGIVGQMYTAYCTNIAGSPTKVTVTVVMSSGSATLSISGSAFDIIGAGNIDANASGFTPSANPFVANFTTTNSGVIAIAGFNNNLGASYTQNNGWTNDSNGLLNSAFAVAHVTGLSSGANSINATCAGGNSFNNWNIISFLNNSPTATLAWIV